MALFSASINKQEEVEDQTNSTSYGTFTPRCVIDSEYLKTLANKDSSSELQQSASLPTGSGSVGVFFPAFLTRSELASGVNSQYTGLGRETRGFSIQNSSIEPNFFVECDTQLSKLSTFMEYHLSRVESAVSNVRETQGKQSIHNPSHADQDKREEDLSDDSGMYDNEVKPLVTTTPAEPEQGKMEDPISLLSRMKEVLFSIKDSLAASFETLDKLVEMHDQQNDSKKGQKFYKSKLVERKSFDTRIDTNLENLDHELNRLYRLQDLDSEISESRRGRSESKITANVRETRVSCTAYFTFLLLLVDYAILAVMYETDYSGKWTVYLRLLRGPFLVVLFMYFYGINMKVWSVMHIDYVNIFDHHPKATPTPNYVFKVSGMFCVFFTVILVALLLSSPYTYEVPGKIAPLVMWASFVVFLFNPFKVLLRSGRFSLLLVFVRILLAPFTFVYFGDFWLADQLNSTVAIMLDLQYLSCYTIADTWYGNANTSICTSSSNGIRPVLSCLPALWRFLQCIRCFYDTRKVAHLVNALKYFTTFPVVLFATMFSTKVPRNFNIWNLSINDVGWMVILWLVSAFIHAVYTFVWDIHRDWGLWSCVSSKTFYRRSLVFRYRIIYFVAMVLDLGLRFAWTIKVSLAIVWHNNSDSIYTVLIVAEIFRRFVWNFFRVEYAHVLETRKHKLDDD